MNRGQGSDMTTRLTPDICVIGAGSGGLSVAAAAAAFGVPVVLVEKGRMGGDCLNYGCVPSKALLAAGKHAHAIREAPHFGVEAGGEPHADFARVRAHVRSVIEAIAPNDSEERFTALGVTVIRAEATFKDRRTVLAGDYEIAARRFVVATGSSPFVPAIPGLLDVAFFTNETIFENAERPEHLIIIGGGPIGLEMAQAHRRLGSRVTVIEAVRALPKDDPELSQVVLSGLRGEGIVIHQGAKVTKVEKSSLGGVLVTFDREGTESAVEGSHLLVAAGRRANVDRLGLENARIRFDSRGIKVNASLRTSNPRVYAIGDVAGLMQFTHVAGYHAGLVIRSILFRMSARPDPDIIPWATFTDPELAHVGLDEKAAREKHRDISVLRWPFHENDRAQAERRTTGMVKVVADRKGRILGASIVGTNAGELINFWALAVSRKLTLRDVVGYVAPYPTLSEAGRRAAVSFYAPIARKPWIRSLIGFLRRFG
jgi:pyruvate/2-oxoglutarate dehydrogenase complex dihydrolipoamide dehydrogenase (E3) component